MILKENVSQISISYAGGSAEWFLEEKEIKGNKLTVSNLAPGKYAIKIHFDKNQSSLPEFALTWTINGVEQSVPSYALKPSEKDQTKNLKINISPYLSLILWIAGNLFVFFLLKPSFSASFDKIKYLILLLIFLCAILANVEA
mgnify:CR=1 FL=1